MGKRYVYVLQYPGTDGRKEMNVFGREVRARMAAHAIAETCGATLDSVPSWRGTDSWQRLFTATGAPTEFTITMKMVR